MREIDANDLDRYITGNWGEDQLRDEEPEELEETEGGSWEEYRHKKKAWQEYLKKQDREEDL